MKKLGWFVWMILFVSSLTVLAWPWSPKAEAGSATVDCTAEQKAACQAGQKVNCTPEQQAERETFIKESVKPYAKPRRDGDAPRGNGADG